MSYRAVLRAPHAPLTFAAALVGRFSYGVVFVSLTVALTDATGSYRLAGAAIALFGVGSFLAPARAGLIDRYGPRRALPPMALAYALLLLALAAATSRPGSPGWLLLALSAGAGACAPPLGPVTRALWAALLPDPALRQRVFALDTVAEELLYVTGPLVAGIFIAAGRPALGVAASAVLVVVGTAGLVASPVAAGPVAGGRPAGSGRPVWEPVIVACGLGAGLGALNLLIVAYATRSGSLVSVAWLEAALAAGSAIGGIAYGAHVWRSPDRVRLPLFAVGVASMIALGGLAPGIAVLAGVSALAGLFVAPTLTTAYLVADRMSAPEARTRAGTWVNTAFNAGTSAGTAAVGLVIGGLPLGLCFVLAAVSVLAPAGVTLARALGGGAREPATAASAA